MEKNKGALWVVGIIAVFIILYYSGNINLASVASPENSYSFTWKNYSFICASEMSCANAGCGGDTDFSDGYVKGIVDNKGGTVIGSVNKGESLQMSVQASSNVYQAVMRITCEIENLDLNGATEIDIYGESAYSCSGTKTTGGGYTSTCGIDDFGISSYDTTYFTASNLVSDIISKKNSKGNWISTDVSGKSGQASEPVSFTVYASTDRGGSDAQIKIEDIIIRRPEVLDCRQMGCQYGSCQSDGTCLYTDVITNTTYQIINNTVFLPVNHTVYINNTVYVHEGIDVNQIWKDYRTPITIALIVIGILIFFKLIK